MNPTPSRRVDFTEVGPRDGFQNWPQPVSTEVKLSLIRGAFSAGVERVEATSFVSPKWVPQMADAAAVMAALTVEERARVRVLVPNLRGYERARESGAGNVLVNVGAVDGFNLKNLNRTVAETLSEIGDLVTQARRDKVRVDASISVAWGSPFDGPVEPARVLDVAAQLVEVGCAELSFGDTIGVAGPSGVRSIAGPAVERFGKTAAISMHFHDTRGMALANAMAALECGVRAFEGSIGGIGGCPFAPRSTGNVCSEDLLAMIEELGYESPIAIDVMVGVARRLGSDLGHELPGRLQRAGRAPWLAAVQA